MNHLTDLSQYYAIEVAAAPVPKEIAFLNKALKEKRLFQYKKFGEISARPAVVGEHVVTIIKGEKETENTAKEGDFVVTGVLGEQYIISGEKLKARYKKTSRKDADGISIYIAVGKCYAAEYKGETFSFKAPWGEDMIVNKGDYIVTPNLLYGKINVYDVYRIEREAFFATYKKV